MDIQIFLWKMDLPSVGHLSMQLSDGCYISFWPDRPLRAAKKKASSAQTFQADVLSEGRQPDQVLELPAAMVDQEKIKSWWHTFMGEANYNLLNLNCAVVVKRALLVGGVFRKEIEDWGEDWGVNGCAVFHPAEKRLALANNTPEAVFKWATHRKKVFEMRIVLKFMKNFSESLSTYNLYMDKQVFMRNQQT